VSDEYREDAADALSAVAGDVTADIYALVAD